MLLVSCLTILPVLFTCFDASSQVNRVWEYSFNPVNNLEASGSCIASLPSGKTVTGGIYRNSSVSVNRNTLLLVDETGTLIDADTTTIGSGFKKVIYDGHSNVLALATLQDDSLPISKIIVARFDTSFTVKNYLIPDTTLTSPAYATLDMSVLSNGNIIVASNWDAFPLRCLSVLCMDTAGNVVWERVDSAFEFSYDVKLVEDLNGGVFAAGSGKDTSTAEDFIFVSHFTSSGLLDWSFRYYSPAQFYADMTDFIRDVYGNLYVSGNVMDTSGQVGCLIKADSAGNIFWNKQILPLAYSRIITDNSGNIYGTTVPLNGLDVFTIDKLDSSGIKIDSSSFQLNGYFASELGDIKFMDGGIISATGGLFVFSFPKSDLFLAAFDTSLNLIGYDIFDSLNLLGENGKAMVQSDDGSVYACGRVNYENQFETCNIGLIKYDVSGVVNNISVANKSRFVIFPNPSSGLLTFRWPDHESEKFSVRIISSTGVEVFNDVVTGNSGQESFILNLPSGIYNVIAENRTEKEVRKLVIIN